MTTQNGGQPATQKAVDHQWLTLHEKLDEILAFQRELKPYLPLLRKLADFVDNPAVRFRGMIRTGKGSKDATS